MSKKIQAKDGLTSRVEDLARSEVRDFNPERVVQEQVLRLEVSVLSRAVKVIVCAGDVIKCVSEGEYMDKRSWL